MRRRNYKLAESFQLIGAFWPYHAPDQRFTGTLMSEQGTITLSSAPEYGMPSLADAAKRGFLGGRPRFQKTDSICGFTEDRNCSLLAVVRLNESGIRDFSTNQMVINQQYRASVAVMGLHVESLDAKAIDSVGFYFTKLHQWLPTPWGTTMTTDGTTYAVPSQAHQVFKFRSSALAADIICEVFAGGGTKLGKRALIQSVPRIRVIPDSPQSVEWFVSIAIRVENFFVLCLGTSVALNKMQLFRRDEIGWLVQKVRRRNEKIDMQLWLKGANQPSIVSSALDKWLSVSEDKRPVEKTVLGIIRKSSVFVETEFLSLAQALEGFSRLQGGPNKRFAKRIEETYDLLTPDFAIKVVGERAAFVRKIVDTRNFFTHLGITAANAAVQDAKHIFDLNQRLHALLRCVMLIQLGVPESYLQEPIVYQATKLRLF